MTTQDVLDGVNTWIVDVCTPAIIGTYTYLPASKTEALPDVVTEVLDIRMVVDDANFPFYQLQQRWVKMWQIQSSFGVDNLTPDAAAEQLQGYADQLDAAIRGDSSLGGRVPFISPFYSFDFTAPFVEYNDGTRFREMNMQIAVGELVEAPE